MSAYEGVQRTMALYCQLCDDGRFDEWGQLFALDATFTVMGNTYKGRDAVQAFITEAQPPELRGKHFLGQSVIDVDHDGASATGVTDYTFIARSERGYAITSAGRYHDTFVRAADGSWLFQSRQICFLGE